MSQRRQDLTKLGFVYAAILLVLSGIVADDWQSVSLFSLLGIYPYGIGLIFWPITGYMLAEPETFFERYLSLSAVLLYDFGVIYKLISYEGDEAAFFERVWRNNQLGLLFLTAFYLLGQLLIVCLIWWRSGNAKEAISNRLLRGAL